MKVKSTDLPEMLLYKWTLLQYQSLLTAGMLSHWTHVHIFIITADCWCTWTEFSWEAAGLLLCSLASPSEFPYTKSPLMWKCFLSHSGLRPMKGAEISGEPSYYQSIRKSTWWPKSVCATCCRWLSRESLSNGERPSFCNLRISSGFL